MPAMIWASLDGLTMVVVGAQGSLVFNPLAAATVSGCVQFEAIQQIMPRN